MDRDLSDPIQEENKLREIRLDAHRLWKFDEAICEEDSDDEDQEEEEESLEEYTTTTTYTHPLLTPPEDQGAKAERSVGFLLEPVRPVHVNGPTGLTKERCKESKKSSRKRSRQAQVSTRPSSSSDDGHTCLIAKNKTEDAQGGDQIKAFKKELESFKLTYASLISNSEALSTNSLSRIDSLLQVAHEVMHRPGKGPAQDGSGKEEDVAGAGDSDDDEGDGSEDEDAGDVEPPVINRPRYAFDRAPTNYFGDGMTETIKRLRRENPYSGPRTARDPRFWTPFQQDFHTTVMLKKSKITHEAQYVDWEHMDRKNDPSLLRL
ncbi:putative copia-type pol polyprotein [Panicum miliaceum]|uniref:Copia-type pol polyprotein n=1 Tax=Panicum miliaceum TaxID=4540 RepID=A0A3L6RP81_PANMI|nr:putative copia-type pol polyprotein [Panicum miliaceum]